MIDGATTSVNLETTLNCFSLNEKTSQALGMNRNMLTEINLETGETNRLDEICELEEGYEYNAIHSDGCFTIVSASGNDVTEDKYVVYLCDSSSLKNLSMISFNVPKIHNLTTRNPISKLGLRRIQSTNWVLASSQYLYLNIMAIDDSNLIFIKSHEVSSEWVFGFAFAGSSIVVHGTDQGKPWLTKLKFKL